MKNEKPDLRGQKRGGEPRNLRKTLGEVEPFRKSLGIKKKGLAGQGGVAWDGKMRTGGWGKGREGVLYERMKPFGVGGKA